MFGGGPSIQLARIFGIRIGASPSWFFVLFALIYLTEVVRVDAGSGEWRVAYMLVHALWQVGHVEVGVTVIGNGLELRVE